MVSIRATLKMNPPNLHGNLTAQPMFLEAPEPVATPRVGSKRKPTQVRPETGRLQRREQGG